MKTKITRLFKFRKYKILFYLLILAIIFFELNKFSNDNSKGVINNDGCVVHFINIGQGDCIFIELPDGKSMLIDSGNNDKTNGKRNGDIIVDYIKGLNYSTIDYVIATHQDSDHVGNMKKIYDEFQVNYTFLPHVHNTYSGATELPYEINPQENGGKVSTTETYGKFLVSVYNEQTEYSFFNKDSDFGNEEFGYSFDFLTPVSNIDDIKYKDSNDYSPIIRFTYADFDILFTGDAENAMLAEYMLNYPDGYDVDLLKVGHHGSNTSTTKEFIDIIKPEYAVIQVGIGNIYNHPRQSVLDILKNANTLIYRNDLNGNIVLRINTDGTYVFTTENTADYNDVLIGY